MRLSEIRKVLKKANALAKQMGNDDPDITFWSDEQDADFHFELAINSEMDDCIVIDSKTPGNFSFRLVEKEIPNIK